MFATTQKSVSMILGAALVAAAAFATPVFAGEAALVQNEQAAQHAIAATVESSTAQVDTAPVALSRNESLAQRAIVDLSTPAFEQSDVLGQATLTQNETAARRSIVDAYASDESARYEGAATTRVASTRSPSTP